MIESLHAGVAVVAVGGAWWSVDVATITEFDSKIVGFYWYAVYFLDVPHLSILVPIIKGYST